MWYDGTDIKDWKCNGKTTQQARRIVEAQQEEKS
jgi:hypothetical protein